jgi:hypothetical protein
VAMGRQGDRQGDLMVMWSEMPRSPGHVFYDRLQQVLVDAGFDGFVEDACRAYYARTMGAPSVPPGLLSHAHDRVLRGVDFLAESGCPENTSGGPVAKRGAIIADQAVAILGRSMTS